LKERLALVTPRHPAPIELNLGPLPVDVINRTLGHDLEPGDVIFSSSAQKHAFARHPDDFGKCLPHVGPIVGRPDFLGDDFKNTGAIELVSRVPILGSGVLVAVLIVPDRNRCYRVKSCYPVGYSKIEGRRQSGRLIIPQWK